LLINEGEARMITGNYNTIAAAKELVDLGPRGVVIKRGEYGFVMYADDQYFILPAYPVPVVKDPTGAGDTFAGGFFGYLSKLNEGWNLTHLKHACIQGCLLASHTVEDFGLSGLKNVDWAKVENRQASYNKVINYLD